MARYCTLLVCTVALSISSLAVATPPSETLLPSTTKGFLSVPDVEELGNRWNETQLGRMANDPVMKPFVDDLREQITAELEALAIPGVKVAAVGKDYTF